MFGEEEDENGVLKMINMSAIYSREREMRGRR
jgi:hypothetical protein